MFSQPTREALNTHFKAYFDHLQPDQEATLPAMVQFAQDKLACSKGKILELMEIRPSEYQITVQQNDGKLPVGMVRDLARVLDPPEALKIDLQKLKMGRGLSLPLVRQQAVNYFAENTEEPRFDHMIEFIAARTASSRKQIAMALDMPWATFHHHLKQPDGKVAEIVVKKLAAKLATPDHLMPELDLLKKAGKISAITRDQVRTYVLDYLALCDLNDEEVMFKELVNDIKATHLAATKIPTSETNILKALGFSHNNFYHHLASVDGKLPQSTVDQIATAISVNPASLASLVEDRLDMKEKKAKAEVVLDLIKREEQLTQNPRPSAPEIVRRLYNDLQPISQNQLSKLLGVAQSSISRYLHTQTGEHTPGIDRALSELQPTHKGRAFHKEAKEEVSFFRNLTADEARGNLHRLQTLILDVADMETKPKSFGVLLRYIQDQDENFILIGRLSSAIGLSPAVISQYLDNPKIPLQPAHMKLVVQHMAKNSPSFQQQLTQLLSPLCAGGPKAGSGLPSPL